MLSWLAHNWFAFTAWISVLGVGLYGWIRSTYWKAKATKNYQSFLIAEIEKTNLEIKAKEDQEYIKAIQSQAKELAALNKKVSNAIDSNPIDVFNDIVRPK